MAENESSPPPLRRSLWPMMLVCALYLATCALSHLAGFRMEVGWNMDQLLDPAALERRPLASLLLLHSQPPLLNTLAAGLLGASSICGCPVTTLARLLFCAIGLLTCIVAYLCFERVVQHRIYALLGSAALVADPGSFIFGHLLFYPFVVQLFVCLLLLLSIRYLQVGTPGRLLSVLAVLALLVLTRSLFHYLFAFAFLALLLLARAWLRPRSWRSQLRAAALPCALLALLLSVWPLKNLLVFGHFTYSSWYGVNLARSTPLRSATLQRFLRHGTVPGPTQRMVKDIERRHGQEGARVVSAVRKSTGGANWNHLLLLQVNQELSRTALSWIWRNPGRYLRRVIYHYLCWTRGTYLHPYEGKITGPANTHYRRYAAAYDWLVYNDLRPWIERAAPSWFRQDPRGRQSRLPYTLFGCLLFPASMVLGVILLVGRARRRRLQEMALLLGLFGVLWSLLLPCLTDGLEGNRLRFSSSPMMLLVACYVLGDVVTRARTWLCTRLALQRR